MTEWQSPFPTVGEIVKFIIDALDIVSFLPAIYKNKDNHSSTADSLDNTTNNKSRNSSNKYFERLTTENRIDFEEASAILQSTICNAFNKFGYQNSEVLNVLLNHAIDFLNKYKMMVLKIHTGGADRQLVMCYMSEWFIYRYYLIRKDLQIACKDLSYPTEPFWLLPEFDQDGRNLTFEKVFIWYYKLFGTGSEYNKYKMASLFYDMKENESKFRSTYKLIDEWTKNDSLPKFDTINALPSLTIKDSLTSTEKITVIHLKIALLLTRFFHYTFDRLVTINSDDKARDTFSLLKSDEIISLPEKLLTDSIKLDIESIRTNPNGFEEIFFDSSLLLFNNTNITKKNSLSIENILKDNIDYLLNHEVLQKHCHLYRVLWHTARFHLLSADFEKSMICYMQAFERAKYCAGSFTKEIIREAITLATYLRYHNKSNIRKFKSLYQWAYYFGLFEQKYSELDETAFIDSQRKQFFSIFNIESFYDSVPESIINSLKEKADRYTGIVYTPDRKIDVDFNDPNKLVEDNFCEISQLMHCIKFFESEEAINLINAGANINYTDSSGASALLYALQSHNKIIVKKILNSGTSLKKIINKTTNVRKFTPLMVAVEVFNDFQLFDLDLEIIELLLANGANPNQKALIDDITPLERLCILLNYKISGWPDIDNLDRKKIVEMAQANQLIKSFSNKLFDNELIADFKDFDDKALVLEIKKNFISHIGKNMDAILKAIELLKKYGAVGRIHLF